MTGAIVLNPTDLPFIESIKHKIIGSSEAMENQLLVSVSIEREDLQEIVDQVIKFQRTNGCIIAPMFPPPTKLAA